jgi:predicted N-acetyltransferase YhbS
MVDAVVREVRPEDGAQISALHARAFVPGRFARTAYRIREGTGAFSPYCRVCLIDKRIIAAVRFTPVRIGGTDGALLLGPLAVDPEFANRGHGRGLVRDAMQAARADGLSLVLLVGDEPYYARLGFVRVPQGQIALPGPVNPQRLLAAELRPGALADYRGLVSASAQRAIRN